MEVTQMSKAAEARHAAVGERELRAIFRAADRKANARKPVIHPLMNADEVCRLFGFKNETLRRRILTGRLPPPCNKALSAPSDPVAREMWQRDHRRWNRKLMEAISWGILPPAIHDFQCPQDWVDFLATYKELAA